MASSSSSPQFPTVGTNQRSPRDVLDGGVRGEDEDTRDMRGGLYLPASFYAGVLDAGVLAEAPELGGRGRHIDRATRTLGAVRGLLVVGATLPGKLGLLEHKVRC